MGKLILMSIIIGMIAIPARLASEADPRKAVKKLVKHMLLFELFYVFLLRFVWGRFE
jgi:hypothetical protein